MKPTGDIYTALDSAAPAVETRTYDELGRLEEVTDYKGQPAFYYYSDEDTNHSVGGSTGQLWRIDYYTLANDPCDKPAPDSITPNDRVEYTYDSLGRRHTVTDSQGTTTYHYDNEGRTLAVQSPQGFVSYIYNSVTGRKIETRTYDSDADLNDDVLAASDNDITRISYDYDELGRLKTVQTLKRDQAELTTPEINTYNYDAVGNREGITIQYGENDIVTTDYTYDALNRLDTITHSHAEIADLSSFDYTVKANGMRYSVGEFIKYPSGQNDESPVVNYGYDNLNRLTSENTTLNGYDITYAYDLAGNRTNRSVTASNGTMITDYDYDDNTDRLLTEENTEPMAMIPWGNDRVYAWAAPGGGITYQVPGHKDRVGQLRALFMGLPSVWSRYLLIAMLVLLPTMLLSPAVVRLYYRLFGKTSPKQKPALSLFYRGISVLLAYAMLISPTLITQTAEAATQYANISTLAWGKVGNTITYEYDANGSLTSKVTTGVDAEEVVYIYNLQNRLSQVVRTTPADLDTDEQEDDAIVETTWYYYNDEGIRVESIYLREEVTDIGQGGESRSTTDNTATSFLIDSFNPTGD